MVIRLIDGHPQFTGVTQHIRYLAGMMQGRILVLSCLRPHLISFHLLSSHLLSSHLFSSHKYDITSHDVIEQKTHTYIHTYIHAPVPCVPERLQGMKERKDRRGTVFPALCVWLVVPREERRVVRLHYYCFVCMCVYVGKTMRCKGIRWSGEGMECWGGGVGAGSRLLARAEGYNFFFFFFLMDGWMGRREGGWGWRWVVRGRCRGASLGRTRGCVMVNELWRASPGQTDGRGTVEHGHSSTVGVVLRR